MPGLKWGKGFVLSAIFLSANFEALLLCAVYKNAAYFGMRIQTPFKYARVRS